MYKYIVYLSLLVILMNAYLDQLSNHMAYTHYYKMKYAINRSTHAAALQIDEIALASGSIAIDEQAAFEAAERLLNLNLDSQNETYKVVFFRVINEVGSDIPYHYINRQWDIDVTLNKPAVVMVIEVSYPHIISSKQPFIWKINGTSEVVTTF